MNGIAIGCGIGGSLLLFLLIICLCQSKFKDREPETKTIKLQTNSLIPPIFYTNGMKDPLLQDDLCEKVKWFCRCCCIWNKCYTILLHFLFDEIFFVPAEKASGCWPSELRDSQVTPHTAAPQHEPNHTRWASFGGE